ncbi:SIR2 family NAD-dependent protein deacylase [Cryptosporangium arvum]|uniref:SIR2 family NAD-dependent protein deacylase n=1 Tax=Cryptosporangium arvum TaxID=80871 RepID=UPI0004B21B98|nr:SIR2 family protein [Cryptosporangium arvum]
MYADEYGYPFRDRDDLSRVMQYAAFQVGDAVDLKSLVAQRLTRYVSPNFRASTSPHGLLARFPIPLYLTTNYDPYMTQALVAHGRPPNTAICHWDRTNTGDPVDPRPEAPVVFHLHGAATDPHSMVLTQDDYLNFLLALAIDKGFDEKSIIPNELLPLMTLRPLLFIGYSLKDWSFQVLSKGLTRLLPREERRRHVSIQLIDPLQDTDRVTFERAMSFLNHHFERQDISVYWGTAENFCTELNRRLGYGHVR